MLAVAYVMRKVSTAYKPYNKYIKYKTRRPKENENNDHTYEMATGNRKYHTELLQHFVMPLTIKISLYDRFSYFMLWTYLLSGC